MSAKSLPSYVETHQIRGDQLYFQLPAEVEWLRSHLSEERARRGETLVKEGSLNVVLTAIRKGGTLGEHEAPGPATVLVVEGRVRMHVGDRIVEMGAGEMVAFDAHVRHDVVALEDSAILITIVFDTTAHQR